MDHGTEVIVGIPPHSCTTNLTFANPINVLQSVIYEDILISVMHDLITKKYQCAREDQNCQSHKIIHDLHESHSLTQCAKVRGRCDVFHCSRNCEEICGISYTIVRCRSVN